MACLSDMHVKNATIIEWLLEMLMRFTPFVHPDHAYRRVLREIFFIVELCPSVLTSRVTTARQIPPI